jgi:hypothetical protein
VGITHPLPIPYALVRRDCYAGASAPMNLWHHRRNRLLPLCAVRRGPELCKSVSVWKQSAWTSLRPCRDGPQVSTGPPSYILRERKVADAGAVRQRRALNTFNPRAEPCRHSPNLASSSQYSMRGVAPCDI